ncbi:MAG: WD40/YVTN/BNR-like repeat-containing protein [Myxococcota bacterium]
MRRARTNWAGAAGAALLCEVLLCCLAGCGTEEVPGSPSSDDLWPTGDLVAVAAPAAGAVIVASRDGRILRSADGGGDWSRSRTPAGSSLADLEMVDHERGWAVGAGTLLRTIDGGASWERQRLPGPAADWPLVGVSALDGKRAVVIAGDGRFLVTVDGGGIWQAPGLPEVASGIAPTRLAAVQCTPRPHPICWAVGDGVVAITPESGVVAVRSLADAAGLAPFTMRVGGVELSAEDTEALRAAARRLAKRPIAWAVEATVTSHERRRYAEDQDPSALFDRIEARTREVVGHLEAMGVEGDRITVLGAPPWGYEEHLDDDPDFLERYWGERLAASPTVAVRATEHVELRAVVVHEGDLVAADVTGRLFEGQGESPLAIRAAPVPHALLDLAETRRGVVAVGRQGGIFVGRPARDGFGLMPAEVGPGGARFETLRSVAFVPGGEVGWSVGDAGRILRSGDGGLSWVSVDPPRRP